jgi:hypothetical protein
VVAVNWQCSRFVVRWSDDDEEGYVERGGLGGMWNARCGRSLECGRRKSCSVFARAEEMRGCVDARQGAACLVGSRQDESSGRTAICDSGRCWRPVTPVLLVVLRPVVVTCGRSQIHSSVDHPPKPDRGRTEHRQGSSAWAAARDAWASRIAWPPKNLRPRLQSPPILPLSLARSLASPSFLLPSAPYHQAMPCDPDVSKPPVEQ